MGVQEILSTNCLNNRNSRPQLSAILKLFENVITLHLQHFCRSVISPCQLGFKKGISITTNLLELTSFVIKGFNKHLKIDTIYTDLSKAIDSVNSVLLARNWMQK